MSYEEEHTEANMLNEPMGVYLIQGSSNPFYWLLGGRQNVTSDYDVLQVSRNGLPKNILVTLAQKISITIQELANIMHISERTLQRYEDNAIVKSEYAEKAVELARLYVRGGEVFGSIDKFKLWMKTPLIVFKGETPLSLLDTSAGFNIVFRELGRIEHGIFA
jgi:putative toxin-antitoxin system antitoxin component (TIGR02293 family)